LRFAIKKQFTATQDTLLSVFGPQFRHKRKIEETLGVKIILRGDQATLQSPSETRLRAAARTFAAFLEKGGASGGPAEAVITHGRRTNIAPKSKGQEKFCGAVRKNDLVFVIGPAGTGKTFLAVAMAVESLRRGETERIVLVRPAVEAGESLGFLPGNFKEKIDPYIAPLYDALHEILPKETLRKYLEEKTIEISPLAYMRGRTLNNAFIILDEAQNARLSQMKMFLTRLGRSAKAVVAGDVTQIDLDAGHSGLLSMEKLLGGIPGIAFVTLDSGDVVRHKLVRNIIDAYEEFEKQNDH
jgi:phosphate starvation-inducible PhoH-like protein